VIKVQVIVESVLDASPGALWIWVASAEGVNHEMAPWLSFTPLEGGDLLAAAASGEVLNLRVRGPLGLPLGRYRCG
jgi:hypothetical protein